MAAIFVDVSVAIVIFVVADFWRRYDFA